MANIVRRVGKCIGIDNLAPHDKDTLDIELSASSQQNDALVGRPLRGFPSLSAFMSSNSNSESFIFKRFDKLAARNLLYLQSELAYLQQRLEKFDEKDAQPRSGLEDRRCARSWDDFEDMKDTSPKQKERWDLMHRIRETLREYRTQFLSPMSAFKCVGSNMFT
jgi:hypothetical protein